MPRQRGRCGYLAFSEILCFPHHKIMLSPTCIIPDHFFPEILKQAWKQIEENPDSRETNVAIAVPLDAEPTVRPVHLPGLSCHCRRRRVPPASPGACYAPGCLEWHWLCFQLFLPLPHSSPLHCSHLHPLCAQHRTFQCASASLYQNSQCQRQQEREKKQNRSLSFVLLSIT